MDEPLVNGRNNPREDSWLTGTPREEEEWGGRVMSVGHGACTGMFQVSTPHLAQQEGQRGRTCITGSVSHDLVHLVRLGDIQLAPLGHLLEVAALVEGAAQPRLPGGGVGLVRPFVILPLVDGPSLQDRECPVHNLTRVSSVQRGPPGYESTGVGGQWGTGTVCPGGLRGAGCCGVTREHTELGSQEPRECARSWAVCARGVHGAKSQR